MKKLDVGIDKIDTSEEGLARAALGVMLMIVGMSETLALFDIQTWVVVKGLRAALILGLGAYVVFLRKK